MGPNSRFPWAGASGGQTATAQSTPEAELASLNTAMKGRGESALDIWKLLLGPYHQSDPKGKPYNNLTPRELNNPMAHHLHGSPWKMFTFIHGGAIPQLLLYCVLE